jgi:nucleotide-binding universal stress UspA family protein
MKTILVLAGGMDSDKVVFATALEMAKLLNAHMEFLHVRLNAGGAAMNSPGAAFATGPALMTALDRLKKEAERRAKAALHHFEQLCEAHQIDIALCPKDARSEGLSVSWRHEENGALAGIVEAARHNDLVIVGRPSWTNRLQSGLVATLLMSAGRPVLIAPPDARQSWRSGTTLFCWKETAESARALGATLPLLRKSKKVIVASVGEGASDSPAGLFHLVQRLEWNGVTAEARWLPKSSEPTARRLDALAHEESADLMIMGGYGRGRLREIVLGGCTQHFLASADRPIILMH